MNTLPPEESDQPPRELRGDLWAQSRYTELVGVLGTPQDRGDHSLLLTLARLFSADETRRLLVMVRRTARAARAD
jgi:hypothetical protein